MKSFFSTAFATLPKCFFMEVVRRTYEDNISNIEQNRWINPIECSDCARWPQFKPTTSRPTDRNAPVVRL